MMQLANFLRRIPPIVLFSVVGLVQMMLIALMVIDRLSVNLKLLAIVVAVG